MSPSNPTAPALASRQPLQTVLAVLLVVVLPLLWQLTPRYEAAGVAVAPLSPALALALCAAAGLGWRALPPLAIGAALTALGWPPELPTAAEVFNAVVLVLQAGFGGLLLRRSSHPDTLALDNGPAIRRLVAVALACAAAGGLAEVVGDQLFAAEASARPVVLGVVRALADGASVIVGVPVLLALVAPAWLRWQPRRRSVALPLALLAGLLALAFNGIDERDRQHAQGRFERDAEIVFARLQAQLDAPLQAVQGLHGVALAAGTSLSPTLFDATARPWLARPGGPASLGWLEIGLRADATPGDALAVQLRHRSMGAPSAAADDPLAASLRPALQKALTQEVPVASAVVRWGDARAPRDGLVLFHALPGSASTTGRVVVYASLQADALLAPVLATRSDALRACVVDKDPQAAQRRLAGPTGCESAATRDGAFTRAVDFDYAGRRFTLQVSQPVRTPGGVWLFALPALGGSVLLAVLLLAVTGRVLRAEHAAFRQSETLRSETAHWRDVHAHGEALLQALLDTVQVGAAVLDRGGRVQRANAAFAELVGLTPEALRQRPIDELLVAAEGTPEAAGRARIAQRLQAQGPDFQHETVHLRTTQGAPRPTLVTLRLLHDDDEHAAVCAVHDLSDNLRRRQAERVLDDVLERARLADVVPAPAPVQPAAVAAPGAPQHVLCIQPDGDGPQALHRLIAERAATQVHRARSGAEGLALAESEQPHLIVLDLDLRDADGLALLRTLAEGAATRSIPVIAVSSDPRPDRIDAAFAAGARAYLTRPLEPRQLLAAIAEVV